MDLSLFYFTVGHGYLKADEASLGDRQPTYSHRLLLLLNMNRFSPYQLQDHIATELARLYAKECQEPFFVAVGRYSDFDIASQSKKIRIEVKCETTSLRTGNVCIEYWNTDWDQASGVLHTKANLWLHLVLEELGVTALEYDIDVLRKLVIEHGEVRSNRRNSLCKIIPLTLFKKFARRSFPFNTKFLEEIEMQGGDTVASAVR